MTTASLSRLSLAVVGAGAWGTALANALARPNRKVGLVARSFEQAVELDRTRINLSHLPGVTIDENVMVTAEPSNFISVQSVLLVVPAQSLRQVVRQWELFLTPETTVIVCAKGIEQETGAFMTDIVAQEAPHLQPAILSGPSFAADVARGLPTALTLASFSLQDAKKTAERLSSPRFRIYHTDDVRGVEIGGAAKNVLAIAAGLVIGKGLGESAKAALIARGFAELMRFATAYGARPETLMGLSGLGDLILTCGSEKSRNFALGLALGRGIPLAQALDGYLAEGAFTAQILHAKAVSANVDMPIVAAVNSILEGHVSVTDAISALMLRPTKSEFAKSEFAKSEFE